MGMAVHLEAIDVAADLNAAGSWRASVDFHGSPGRIGVPSRSACWSMRFYGAHRPARNAIRFD